MKINRSSLIAITALVAIALCFFAWWGYSSYFKRNIYPNTPVGRDKLIEDSFNESCQHFGFAISDLSWETIFVYPQRLPRSLSEDGESDKYVIQNLEARKIRLWLINLVTDLNDEDPAMMIEVALLNPTEKAFLKSTRFRSLHYMGDLWRVWKSHNLPKSEKEQRERLLFAVMEDPIIIYNPIDHLILEERIYHHAKEILVDFRVNRGDSGFDDGPRYSLVTLIEGLEWSDLPHFSAPLAAELSDEERSLFSINVNAWKDFFERSAPKRRIQGEYSDLYRKILLEYEGNRIGAR